jgi:uncharacterized damage-inducible protein DinB
MQLPSSVSTRLQYQHKSLLDIIEGLSDDQIRMQINPGKWSIFENIAHLQTYQHMFITRIRLILTEEIPVFSPYSAETDPLFHDNCGLSSREVMQDLLGTRKQLSSAILTFKETDFEREALHSTYGKMNLLLWLNFFLLHEAHHLFTIFKLAAELRKDQR